MQQICCTVGNKHAYRYLYSRWLPTVNCRNWQKRGKCHLPGIFSRETPLQRDCARPRGLRIPIPARRGGPESLMPHTLRLPPMDPTSSRCLRHPGHFSFIHSHEQAQFVYKQKMPATPCRLSVEFHHTQKKPMLLHRLSGGRWDSNPRPLVPQTSALTN